MQETRYMEIKNMKKDPEPELITVEEMQKMLCIGKSKAYALLAEEPSIEAVRIGRCVRVRRKSVDRFLEENPYREDYEI